MTPPPAQSEVDEGGEGSAPALVRCRKSKNCSKLNRHVGNCDSKLAKKPKKPKKAPEKASKKAASAPPAAAPPAKRPKKAAVPPVEIEKFPDEIEKSLRTLCAAAKALEAEEVPAEYLNSEVEKKMKEHWGEGGFPYGDQAAINQIPSLCAQFKKEAIEAYRSSHPTSLRTKYKAALEAVKAIEEALEEQPEIAITSGEPNTSTAA